MLRLYRLASASPLVRATARLNAASCHSEPTRERLAIWLATPRAPPCVLMICAIPTGPPSAAARDLRVGEPADADRMRDIRDGGPLGDMLGELPVRNSLLVASLTDIRLRMERDLLRRCSGSTRSASCGNWRETSSNAPTYNSIMSQKVQARTWEGVISR